MLNPFDRKSQTNIKYNKNVLNNAPVTSTSMATAATPAITTTAALSNNANILNNNNNNNYNLMTGHNVTAGGLGHVHRLQQRYPPRHMAGSPSSSSSKSSPSSTSSPPAPRVVQSYTNQSSTSMGGPSGFATVTRNIPKENMIERIIKSLVSDLTTRLRSYTSNIFEQQQQATLQQYFRSIKTRDLVYYQILAHSSEETDTVALLKCINLIKSNIKINRPSIQVIIDIDNFCKKLQESGASQKHCRIQKNVSFIRRLINSKDELGLSPEDQQQWNTHLARSYQLTLNKQLDKNKSSPFTTGSNLQTLKRLSSNLSMNVEEQVFSSLVFVKNALELRKMFSSLNQSNSRNSIGEDFWNIQNGNSNTGGLSRTLLDSLIFGGQFRKVTKFEDKKPEFDISTCIHVENVEIVKSQIKTVKNLKESENQKDNSIEKKKKNIYQILGYSIPLFEISDSVLKDQEDFNVILNSLIETILMSEESKLRIEATSSLLRVFCDLYKTSSQESTAIMQLKSFFIEMLDSPHSNIRSHAFHMLFNLFVQLVLNNEEYKPTIASSTSMESDEYDKGWIESDLFNKFCDMAQYILYSGENSDQVWYSSLGTFICFLEYLNKGDDGSIFNVVTNFRAPNASNLNIRVLSQYIKIVLNCNYPNIRTHRLLMQVLTNSLYKKNIRMGHSSNLVIEQKLDLEKLKILEGGIFFIIDQYLWTHSTEVKQNCFMLIFDYVISEMESKKTTPFELDSGQIDVVLEILRCADAPLYLSQIFRFLPENFVQNFSTFLFSDLLVKQKQFSHWSRTIDTEMLYNFVNTLNNLAVDYLRIENEFFIKCYKLAIEQNNQKTLHKRMESLFSIITSLLFEYKNSSERKNGEDLMFLLIKLSEEGFLASKIKDKLDTVLVEIATHNLPQTRLTYLNIVEKIMLSQRAKITQHGDPEKIRWVMKTINETLLKFVTLKERDISILLRIMYIIIDFIAAYVIRGKVERKYRSINMNLYATSQDEDEDEIQENIPIMLEKMGIVEKKKKTTIEMRDNVPKYSNQKWKQDSKGDKELETIEQKDTEEGEEEERETIADDIFEMFFDGSLYIPYNLLKEINISIFHHLFINFSHFCIDHSKSASPKDEMTFSDINEQVIKTVENARVVLLLFIIEKCRSKSVLDSIGGMSFFRTLLDDPNAAIAYFASKYLMKQLCISSPEQYFTYLNHLIAKAQVMNTPQLLENPYLQATKSFE